jgi:steroid delta-isomerase-like uncharacterized protein
MLDIIKKNLAALTSSNWGEYRTTLAGDAAYEEVPSQTRVVGLEQCLAAAQRWKTAFPDLRATINRAYTAGDRAVIEVEWEGTQSGPLEGVFGSLPPTHRRGRVHAVMVFTVRDSKIVDSRHYFDMLTVLAQLGVAPIIGSAMGASHPETARW